MRFLFALLLMIPAPSFASECPVLAGEYSCTNKEGKQSQLRMTQRQENGVEVYNDRSDDYYADGQPRPLNWGFFIGKGVATCSSGTLEITVEGEVFADEGKFADISNISQYRMRDASVLVIREKYERWRTDGKHDLIFDEFICRRE